MPDDETVPCHVAPGIDTARGVVRVLLDPNTPAQQCLVLGAEASIELGERLVSLGRKLLGQRGERKLPIERVRPVQLDS
jgi:hypothetical protein